MKTVENFSKDLTMSKTASKEIISIKDKDNLKEVATIKIDKDLNKVTLLVCNKKEKVKIVLNEYKIIELVKTHLNI